MSLYPDETTITLPNGHQRRWPGLKAGKFSNGNPSDPSDLPSGIPAETINLVVDLLEHFITNHGGSPNNHSRDQVSAAFANALRTRQAIFKDFGAISDGVWDCSVLFATVVDAFDGEHGVVRLTEGIYRLSQLTIPANIIVKIEPGARILVPAGTQLVINGQIEAGTFPIFTGPGNIITQRDFTVLPEWWGAFDTGKGEPLALAYNFLSPTAGGSIRLQSRVYVSPFFTLDGAITKDNIKLVGGMMPTVQADRTRLKVGSGTILLGAVLVSGNNVEVSNLGIDSGSWVCGNLTTNSYAGPGADCLMFLGGETRRTGVRVNNIQTLGRSADSTYHGILFEQYDNVFATNLRTTYCSHGVAIKSRNVEIHGIHGEGHDFNSVIIKAEATIPCSDVNLFGVFATSTDSFNGAGVFVQAFSGDVSRVRIVGLTAKNVKWALRVSPNSNGNRVTDILIDGLQVDSAQEYIKVIGTGGFNVERLAIRHGMIRNSNSLAIQMRNTRECIVSDLSILDVHDVGLGKNGIWAEYGNYHLRFQSLYFSGVTAGISNSNSDYPIFADGLSGDGVEAALAVDSNGGITKTTLFDRELVDSKFPGLTSLGLRELNASGPLGNIPVNGLIQIHCSVACNILLPEGLFTIASAGAGSTVYHYLTGQTMNLNPGDYFVHRYV